MIENAKGNIELEIEAQENSGFLEYSFGNFKNAVEHYKNANILMLSKLPIEDWKKYLNIRLIESVEAYLIEQDSKEG